MTRSKSIIAALALCALSVFAFGATSASAAGLTAVECVGAVGGKYNTSECLTPATAGNFETKVITSPLEVEGTSTTASHVTGSTASPVSVFHSTLSGVEVNVTCGAGTTAGGKLTNIEEGGEMKIHGTEGVTTWTSCHAAPTNKPKKICSVQGTAPATAVGEVKTNKLTTLTGPEHKVTIKPETGTAFTKFTILTTGTGEEACFTATAIEVEVTGEVGGEANTTTHSHLTLNATNNGTALKANGTTSTQTETVKGTKKGSATLVGAETF